MKDYIATSLFDIFKIGPGPSSSHTIGPMKAALHFRKVVETKISEEDLSGANVDVYLYGSLSFTGLGHGTHKAITGGLLGWTPDSCDCDQLLSLLEY
jgi:L-serine dehydratase